MSRRVTVTLTVDLPESPTGGWSTLESLTSAVSRVAKGRQFTQAVLRSLTGPAPHVTLPGADYVDVRHPGHLPAMVQVRYEDDDRARLAVVLADRDRLRYRRGR